MWFKADVWKYKREYDSYTLDTMGAGVTLGHPLFWKIVGYVGYKYSIDNIQDINYATASYYIKVQEGERKTSAVTFTLSYDTTNDVMFPSKGLKSTASVQYAGMPLGGNTKFVKYNASTIGFVPPFWDMVFSLKGQIGYLQNNDDSDDKIPIYERYVLGGINSLRGLALRGADQSGNQRRGRRHHHAHRDRGGGFSARQRRRNKGRRILRHGQHLERRLLSRRPEKHLQAPASAGVLPSARFAWSTATCWTTRD